MKKVSKSGDFIEIGKVAAIVYESIDEGKKKYFRHDYKKSARPGLGINGGGDYTLVGSGSRFTDRGIVDK